ncbi:MAG: ORF6N domain-containing protein [Lentimicrobiaceae bacterium]|nr:ORF6N domain-containing protein [Lentimicrobiaceae bacterium]
MEMSIIQSIHEIRGVKVMLDFDLAKRYEVETKRLKEAVRRNIARFEGDDFMFQLTNQEFSDLRTQFATSSWGGIRYPPYAFTELGVAMLSSVLNSETAIDANRKIMRAFVMIRQYALNYAELNQKIEKFIQETNVKFENNDAKTNEIFVLLKELLEHKKELEKPSNPIGFKTSANR